MGNLSDKAKAAAKKKAAETFPKTTKAVKGTKGAVNAARGVVNGKCGCGTVLKNSRCPKCT